MNTPLKHRFKPGDEVIIHLPTYPESYFNLKSGTVLSSPKSSSKLYKVRVHGIPKEPHEGDDYDVFPIVAEYLIPATEISKVLYL